MTYEGSCHCGRVAFELEADSPIESAMDCNCSLCRRRGSLLAFFPRGQLTLKTPEANMATYTFNRHAIRHHFCPNCGIGVFGEAVDPRTGEPTAAVNVRVLPAVDPAALKVTMFDGASR